MYLALRRTENETDPSYGFVRDGALLVVLFLTDEVDCSLNKDHGDILSSTGDRAFWQDKSADYPTSAVCWNAGVACTGSGMPYEACEPEDYDETGMPTASFDDAVLYPIGRYLDLLHAIEGDKARLDPDQEVLVAALAGVPPGYPDTPLVYQDSPDPVFQTDFGIGAGCESANGSAVPPVRLRRFAEAFRLGSSPNLFSICAADYGPSLGLIAQQIAGKLAR
jgi:hypothetical protein